MSGTEERDRDDVRSAFRGLPPVEPDAALDARVRTAVAAELGDGPAAGANASQASRPPAAAGRVVHFPRWRRVALPLATAATLVVAVGLWQLRGTRGAGPASGTALESIVASAPVGPVATDDAALPARAPEAVERRAAPAPASAQAARRRAEPGVVARIAADAPLQEVTASSASAPVPAAAPALASSTAAPAAAKLADGAPAARPQPSAAGASVSQEDDATTLAEVRRLVAMHRQDEARALLLRWLEAHAGKAVPADLRALLPADAR